MLIHLVCAARPNFMKVAPLYHALKKEPWARPVIVHTGQHYDANMSDTFFADLGLPKPHIYLGIGSGTHAEQTAKVMLAYEKVILEQRPDLIVVVGDVNSTMAVTLVASKIVYANDGSGIAANGSHRPLVAHLEAGLRSFDRSMPEEINRLVTDALADRLWTPSPDANENLTKEGVPPEKVQLVGNIMIDSLEMMRERIEKERTYQDFGVEPGGYCVATFHRPSNVDEPSVLKTLCSVLESIASKLPVIFPIHPRTRRNLEKDGLALGAHAPKNLFLPEPLSYIRFMSLVFNCKLVVTDSGGVQEETSYLGVPCLTVRENTERPITITHGTNQLCKLDDLEEKVGQVLQGKTNGRSRIEFWDGKTADRIVHILKTTILLDSATG
jgi:UDP-N-acetylglucosamine 2-epimerase (non-hydrolysing)